MIAGLANAAVIDLSQFVGLADTEGRRAAADDDEYGELLAALRSTPPVAAAQRPYEVSVIGRWTESDGARPFPAEPRPVETPSTPLAGQRCELDLEDRQGRRRAVLDGVVPGRRYVVGKDASCDIAIDGTYVSRRHARSGSSATLDVADAGSTTPPRENGLSVLGRRGAVPYRCRGTESGAPGACGRTPSGRRRCQADAPIGSSTVRGSSSRRAEGAAERLSLASHLPSRRRRRTL